MASVASTYARAFADVIFDRKLDAAKTVGEVQALAALVAGSKELREVLESPSIPADQKHGLLDAIVKREGVAREVRNFVAVLIDNRRMHFLGPIVAQLRQELNQRMGFTEAEIVSTRELSANEKKMLESQVESLTGKKVKASYTLDKTLLGGAVIRVGSTIYDGSVKGQLERIREAISS